MSTSMETPNKTPNSSGHLRSDNVLSTPLFVPPTPMLKELGYGTGKSNHLIWKFHSLTSIIIRNKLQLNQKNVFYFEKVFTFIASSGRQ